MAVFIPIYILWELSAFLVKPAPKDDDEEDEDDYSSITDDGDYRPAGGGN